MTTLLRLPRLLLVLILAMRCAPGLADSASLLTQVQTISNMRYQFAVGKNAEISATSDNRAFSIWWQPSNTITPKGVIVTLHGHQSYATDEFYLWQPYAEKYGYAILALQWWFGSGDATSDYYTPTDMYPLLAAQLKSKGATPGTVMLHGYSRGSANSYAVAAFDAVASQRYFGMVLSVSGQMASGYPPNQEVIAGKFGSKPYTSVQWVLYCGEKDVDPIVCPAMKGSRDWVAAYGATVALFIDDTTGDHGGFMLNSANVESALAAYENMLASRGSTSGAPVCALSASPSSITTGASTTLTTTCNPAASSYIWTGGSCSNTAATCTVTPTTTTTYTVTGSNTSGTSQAVSATVTVSAVTSTASYTVSGTLGNDVFVLTAGNAYYGGGGGDTYIISPSTFSGNVTARIIDTEGDNLIQLVDGMTVAASTFYTDAAQLTLSNGAKVQVLGAARFKFQLGANAPAGDTATALGYSDFVTSLGASLTSGTLPASGSAGYVVPTGFTQATAPVASVAGNASTVAGTLGDDVLVPSGGNNHLGGGGNDTYIISPYTLSGAVTAKIIDTEGTNVIQLVNGLTIASSSFFNNAVQLTLSNGAIVQILGAASFGYQLGANAPAGQTASSQSYAQFAATLGASVPAGTSAVSGSANYVVQGTTSAGTSLMLD